MESTHSSKSANVGENKCLRNYEVYDYFVANQDRLLSVEFLAAFLQPHCVFKRLRMRGSRLRIIQIPWEFASFLIFMAERQINSYLEIGTSTGGSWFTIDSYLRAVNSQFQGSTGFDRVAKLRDYETYHALFPTCNFYRCHSKDLALTEPCDMAFVDARHEESWVWHDFKKLQSYARFVAFHDIVLHGCTVDRFWNTAKEQYRSWEFIDRTLPETCGIGILELPGHR